MKRRKFLKTSITAAASLSAFSTRAWGKQTNQNSGFFIGTPVLPEYLFDKGIANSLDAMQEMAGINTVMTFSHDHVFNQYQKNFRPKTDENGKEYTNIWVKSDPALYPNPEMGKQDPTAKYAGRDVLDELWAEAEPRKMKVYARILEPYVITGAIPGFEEFAEVDVFGNKGKNVCFNHPGYNRYWEVVIEDLVKAHPYLHGFKFGQERAGPFLAALGKNTAGTCFCEHCLKLAAERKIGIEGARKGLIELQNYGNSINAGKKPIDGNFTAFMRLLFQYPDMLKWEQFWMDSRENQRKRIYTQIKNINPNIQVGWHIDHGMTWDLMMRASWDYGKMGPYSDWLSVAVYFDSMGRRSLGHYQRNYEKILFGDADQRYSYPMYLSMLGYDPELEPTLHQHLEKDTAFSSDYVFQECSRAVKRVNGEALVYARPGFDMPGYDCNVSPSQVYEVVTKALEAGVNGLWCGREWDELKPENAVAFGNAIRDWEKKK
ncbi:hypothetical protein [Aquiflexum gelatinilyticum]|uniref:hypothetical protein n=1 Tax=Aquiflexum gelatinilyticum TaxID=2961943 RepID=UPI002167BC23|nr:hypothetical protein [Aquiflexum gelatinilyticum]MCS4435764.1 hypothetical protein [Aquiflexum gelatinilyticum]